MNTQMVRALKQLEAEGRTLNIFFRDDDVDVDEETLRQLLDLFEQLQTPVNLEVIPSALTDQAVVLLRQCPRLFFELNQHGRRHVNHEREGRKCEFGASRTFDEQMADIAAGQRRMNEAFAGDWSPVFTPPWNRCTEATWLALDRLGFAALSKDRGKQPITGCQVREISVTLDLYRWKGGPAMKSPEYILEELTLQMRELDTIGILLHHKVMDSTAFSFLRELIESLRACPNVRFHTFQSLLMTEPESGAFAN